MTLALTTEKRIKIRKLAKEMLENKKPTIREVAKLVGNLVATSDAVPLAPRYYRKMEIDKAKALKMAKGNYKAKTVLSTEAISDLIWWINNLSTVFRSLLPLPITVTIFTDASKVGWGAAMNGKHTQGQWLITEWKEGNINVAETTAAYFALKAFERDIVPDLQPGRHLFSAHVRLIIDNTTAVAYINHMGGSKSAKCNKVARLIWKWAEKHGVWISAAHVPGKKNILADYYSRKQNDAKEWAITKCTFLKVTDIFGSPDIDLFASRTNHKTEQFVSWHPDPMSIGIDAFSLDWSVYKLSYCFPPFSVVAKVLKKVREEKATIILIAPFWHTQSWYPNLMPLLIDYPVVFQASRANLYLPHKPKLGHPLRDKLHLMAVKLSGKSSQIMSFRRKLKNWSSHHGGRIPGRGMMVSSKNGRSFVLEGMKIPFSLL